MSCKSNAKASVVCILYTIDSLNTILVVSREENALCVVYRIEVMCTSIQCSHQCLHYVTSS